MACLQIFVIVGHAQNVMVGHQKDIHANKLRINSLYFVVMVGHAQIVMVGHGE